MLRFLRYAERGCGLESLAEVTAEHVRGFVLAPSGGRQGAAPSVATSHLRRSAVRLLFRVLRQASVVEHDPTLDLVLPAAVIARGAAADRRRDRSGSELLVKDARGDSSACCVGARGSDGSDVGAFGDPDPRRGPRRGLASGLPGARRPIPVGAASPSGASRPSLDALPCLDASPDAPLVYDGAGSGESRQASACAAISETLRRAGLAGEPDVRPVSVAAWAGARILEQTGQIEAVARALGMRSLDRAARLIGWDWTTPDRADP